MIAVDTSALVAVAPSEDDAQAFDQIISSQASLIGAPTLFETGIVLASRLQGHHETFLDAVRRQPTIRIIAFSEAHIDAALLGYQRFGKGRGHPAQLDFGNCLSYAVAKYHDVPLLYKGEDFRHTDLRSALP